MPGLSCNADTILLNATWNGQKFNLVTGVSYTISVTDVPIRNEGKIGPGCRGTIGGDISASVTYLVAPPPDPIANKVTVADLVFTTVQAGEATRTCTIANMTPRGTTYAFDRESPPGTYVTHLVLTDDLDTLPITNP